MPGFQSRLYSLFLVLLFVVQLPAQKKTDVLTRKYPAEALRADLDLMKRVVLSMHPSVGIYHDKPFYEAYFEKAMRSINDSMSEKSFRVYCKQLIEELHCGHTEVMGSKAYNKAISKARLNYSPYIFLPVNEKLFVIANLNKKQDSLIPKGVEVKSLNAISADSLMRYCRRFISTDGYNQTSKYHFVQLGFNNLYPSLFGRPDSLQMEYKEGNTLKKHSYAAFKVKNIPPIPLKKVEDSLFTSRKKAGIRYRVTGPEKQIFILKLDKFANSSYKKVYRKVFKKLEKENTQHLVLDLRNNGGGSLANAYKLLGYFMDSAYTQTLYTRVKNYPEKKHTRGNLAFKFTRYVFSVIGKKTSMGDTDYYAYTLKLDKKHRYTGKLYVLMNGGTFSASCLVGAYLKERKNTVFLGEESGGAAEGCNAGVTPYYTLPNTGIRVRVPAFRVRHDVHPQLTGHGLIPDYPIHYSFKDLISRKDLELLKVLELVKTAQ
ncbi:MAG: S41 family peptidase [Bacteroidia bacterium]|nr:S41 family peptidase [Bacteroidia bacterium]